MSLERLVDGTGVSLKVVKTAEGTTPLTRAALGSVGQDNKAIKRALKLFS